MKKEEDAKENTFDYRNDISRQIDLYKGGNPAVASVEKTGAHLALMGSPTFWRRCVNHPYKVC